MNDPDGAPISGPRVVVVGSCASGKSTLVSALRDAGVDASVVAQEHSEIATLWNHSEPDLLVMIEIDLETIRERRSPTWSEQIYHEQQRRLEHARASAAVVIQAGSTSVTESVHAVMRAISTMRD